MATWKLLPDGHSRYDLDQVFAVTIVSQALRDGGFVYSVTALTAGNAKVTVADDLASEEDANAVVDALFPTVP